MNQNLSKIILAGIITFGVVAFYHSTSHANETADLKNQVKVLQEKIDRLEKQLGTNQGAALPRAPAVRTSPSRIHYYDIWDPFEEMRAMEQQMNHLMKDNMIDFNPREDVKQTTDHYIINMDLPGMEKDKINVEVKSGALIVSGERSSEVKEDKPHQYYRQERSFGHFYRSIPLPGDALSDNIDAQYQNGVLTVKIARNKSKSKEADTQKIKIK